MKQTNLASRLYQKTYKSLSLCMCVSVCEDVCVCVCCDTSPAVCTGCCCLPLWVVDYSSVWCGVAGRTLGCPRSRWIAVTLRGALPRDGCVSPCLRGVSEVLV